MASLLHNPPKSQIPPLSLCLVNLRSVYNVGSIFRIADSLGVSYIFLCGLTPLPYHPRFNKTALGSQVTVPWEHHCVTKSFIPLLKQAGWSIVCLETDKSASPLPSFRFLDPTCIFIGHEIKGLSPSILKLADHIASIPQQGFKESLNVATVTAMAVYEWFRQYH